MFLAELDEAGNQAKTYTLGNEYAGHVSELNNSLTSENKAASYYITDEQGSIRYILDQSGEVQNYYQYSAFGETIISEETTPNRLRYNAQTEDELTGLYYLRARYYAPSIGRFTQEDVIYNDGLNLYAYCNSNPVMYSDPSGFAKETCKSKVGGECGSESGSTTITVSQDRLQHSVLGEFNSNRRLINGGHGQANINYLNQNNIEYNIVKVYDNGVRVGNIPSHKNKFKRTGTGQAWFPESWTEIDIKNAGEYVANIPENVNIPDGAWIFGEYNSVRVGIIKNNGEIGTIIPDNSRQP